MSMMWSGTMLYFQGLLKIPFIFYIVVLAFGKWIYARGTQLFACYLLPGVCGTFFASLNSLKFVAKLPYHFVCTVTSVYGEWIYVILNILKCTVAQTAYVFLCCVTETLVLTWQLAISPLLTTTSKCLLPFVDLYPVSGWDIFNKLVIIPLSGMVELIFVGVKTLYGLLMVLWYFLLQLLSHTFRLVPAIVKTLFATFSSLLYHVTVSVVNVTIMCARAVATASIWLSLGLQILFDLVYNILLVIVNLSLFGGSQFYSIVSNLVFLLSAVAKDLLNAIYQFTRMFIKLTYFTSTVFMKDTVQLTYRLFLYLLYNVLPWIWQLIGDFVWTVVVQLQTYICMYPLGVLLTVVLLTLWLRSVVESARRTNNGKYEHNNYS